jgi:hypothetical protein
MVGGGPTKAMGVRLGGRYRCKKSSVGGGWIRLDGVLT